MEKKKAFEGKIPAPHKSINHQTAQRLFEPTAAQTQLKIGKAGDKYEQEADRVAEQVVRMPEPHLQRQPEEREESIQPKGPTLQTPARTSALESGLKALKGTGQPLPESTRKFFEPRFDCDFSGVRVHTGGDVVQISRGLNAEAFTYGRDIYFGEGRYNPNTTSGKRILAHELTHVVQQSSIKAASSGIVKNILSSLEPRISRWKIEGNIATVTKKGDTLWALAKRITGDGRNWPFIKKIKMQSPKAKSPEYWLYLRIGDIFDISDLLAAAPEPHKAKKAEKIVFGEEIVKGEQWKSLSPEKKVAIWQDFTPEDKEVFEKLHGPTVKIMIMPWKEKKKLSDEETLEKIKEGIKLYQESKGKLIDCWYAAYVEASNEVFLKGVINMKPERMSQFLTTNLAKIALMIDALVSNLKIDRGDAELLLNQILETTRQKYADKCPTDYLLEATK